MKVTGLRKLARGRPCQVRLSGICNGGAETTVLAHYRAAGLCGMAQKPHDLLGAWACSDCHDVIDGRRRTEHERDSLRHAFAEGVMRTQAQLAREGVI